MSENIGPSGYVALAVATDSRVTTRDIETSHGGDREKNMIEFACEGLKLLRDVIQEETKE